MGEQSNRSERRGIERGVRYGLLGPIGLFLRPGSSRSAVESVSEPTRRGVVNVSLWFVAVCAIGWLGRLVTGWSGAVWFAIALVVMIPIGWNWPYGKDLETEAPTD